MTAGDADTPKPARRAALGDASLYGLSALFCVGVALFASIPQYREWGRLALGPYLAGAALAAGMWVGRASVRARAWLAVAVLAGSGLLPLALEARWRAEAGPGSHAQSEVIVTEEAARAFAHGHDPYATSFAHGPLAARPVGTKTHFPYLPAMLVFGLPRGAGGTLPWTDARVFFALGTLGAAAAALRRGPSAAALRAFQILAVLPTGALLMATGGDDLPVLGLMLLALVLARDGRLGLAGLAAGAAAAAKQTAWPLLPFLALAVRRDDRERANPVGRFATGALVVAVPIVLPFVAWNPGAFVEDAVRFPLGLGTSASAAGTPTPGSVLVRAFSGARTPVTVLLLAVVAAVGLALLARARSGRGGPAGAARATGILLAVAFVLAPAARFGYVVYPIDLLVWSGLLATSPTG